MSMFVPDTSVIVSGAIVRMATDGELRGARIMIPNAVMDEIQSQANRKMRQGYDGLEHAKRLQEMASGDGIAIAFGGTRPTLDEIKMAPGGRIDAMVIDLARQHGAILLTADNVQVLTAKAQGVRVRHVEPEASSGEDFMRFFDENTMSVHLKEGMAPVAKRGVPGSFGLHRIQDEPVGRRELEQIISDVTGMVGRDKADMDISMPGADVVQYGQYRIAITRPPFSDGIEVTMVRPVAKMSLDDYDVSDKLRRRLDEHAEGILISGAPGSGKSTLASGLANHYYSQDKIVKTFESPRDLQVEPGITQYSRLDGSFANTADILLLVRPDFTVFDEVRRKEDFEVYADLRLAGVGMIGIIHANTPVDAIQRFVGKIDLGMIPSILDTIIFVQDGRISKVYGVRLTVKVPAGMTEQDLARPVIEISDFETQKPEYEIYTFGSENVIIPISDEGATGIRRLAEEKISEVMSRYDPSAEVSVTSDSSIMVRVSRHAIPSIIGRGGSNIQDLERQLQVHIDVQPRDLQDTPEDTEYEYGESRTALVFNVDRRHAGMRGQIFVNGDLAASAKVGRRGQIKIPKRSADAHRILGAASKDDIRVSVMDF